MDPSERLGKIYEKIRELNEEKARLIEENNALKTENQELKEELKSLKNSVNEIKQKNVNLQLAKKISDEELDHKAIKAQIDSFVKEIDKCLEFLKTR